MRKWQFMKESDPFELPVPLQKWLFAALRGEPIAWPGAESIDDLVRTVRAHGVGGFLHKLPLPEDVPEALKSALYEIYWGTALNRATLQHDLDILRARLNAAGIDVIVLKGIVYGYLLYEDWAQRNMNDVDILLHRKDIPSARVIIEEMGYTPGTIIGTATPEDHISFGTQIPYRRKAQGGLELRIELHWHIVEDTYYYRRIPIADLWARRTKLEEADLWMLNPADQLVAHMIHMILAHHKEIRLHWLVDLSRYIDYFNEVERWPEVIEQAKAYGVMLPCREAFNILDECLGVRPPDTIWYTFNSHKPARDEISAYHLALEGLHSVAAQHRARAFGLSTSEKVHYILSIMLPSPAYMWKRYGVQGGTVKTRLLLPLLYVWRWLRAMVMGSRLILKR